MKREYIAISLIIAIAHSQTAVLAQCAEWSTLIKESSNVGRTGDFKTAIDLATKAQSTLGDDRESRVLKAITLSNISQFRIGQGSFAEAEIASRQALSLAKSALEPDAMELSAFLNSLAQVLKYQDRFSEAEEILLEASRVDAKNASNPRCNSLRTTNAITDICLSQGKLAEAESYARKAFTLSGEANVRAEDKSAAVNNLAVMMQRQARYEEAEKLLLESIRIAKTNAGSSSADLISSYDNLAGVLEQQGKVDEANRVRSEALKLAMVTLGDHHPDTKKIRVNMASALAGKSKFTEASKMLDAMGENTTDEKEAGISSQDYIIMINSAMTKAAEGNVLVAMQILQRCLNELKVKPNDSIRSVVLNDLSSLLIKENRYKDAIPLLEECLDIRIRLCGPNHRDVAIVQNNLAEAYIRDGQFDSAEALFKKAISTCIAAGVSKDDQFLVAIIDGYCALLEATGRSEEAASFRERILRTGN